MDKKSKVLTKREKQVFDLLVKYKSEEMTTNKLIWLFWKTYISKGYNLADQFTLDFIGGDIPCEGITRASRKVREKYPDLFPRSRKATSKEIEYFDHYKTDHNPAQGSLI